MTKRRTLALLVGAAILGGVTYVAYIYLTAESRVREACAQIKPGTTLAALRLFAEQRGMRKPTRDSGMDYLVETKTFGRFGCAVTMETGVVRKVEYHFAD